MEVSASSPMVSQIIIMIIMMVFIESFLQMSFEGKWLQNRLRADKNESISLSAVDIQGNKCGGFCIVPRYLLLADS